MGSFATSSIALSGLGWSSITVCSKRGPDWPAGRGRWFVDHVEARFGAWGVSVGIGLACAGTAEEEVVEDDEGRTSAGRRRPARVAAATRRVEIMTFDQCLLRIGELTDD